MAVGSVQQGRRGDGIRPRWPRPWPVPITVLPSSRVTCAAASAVPVKVGVASLVMLSVFDTPLSVAAVMSGTDGGTTTVSMVTARAADAALGMPAAFVATALMLCTPFSRVAELICHAPAAVATPVPIAVVPSNRVTVQSGRGGALEGRRGHVGDVVGGGSAAVRGRDQIRAGRRRGWRGTMVTDKAPDADADIARHDPSRWR